MPESAPVKKPPGLVYTFYSYKGGVGRSMALANIGVLMATEGHRVLLVDWDLEAPGLEVFFRQADKLVGTSAETPGIVDLLEARSQKTPLTWRDCLLKAEFFGHTLDIISAGRRTEDYRRRVQQLDWDTLFREHGIGDYINTLREEWRDSYDFVLVDSRTGITDIGDICTVILPDILVLLFVTNNQNVEGIKGMMARAIKARSKLPVNRSKLLGVPVPTRDERDREYDRSLEWQRTFATEFGDLYREWLPKEVGPADALNRIFVPYIASWSFGERIPVIESERERSDPTSLGAAYARLATLLSHRLDWSAVEAKATAADSVGARVELSKAREAVRDAEVRLVEESKRREEEVREQEAKRLETVKQLEQAQLAAAKARKRSRIISGIWLVLFLLAGVGIYRLGFAKPSLAKLQAELQSSDPATREGALLQITLRDAAALPLVPTVAGALDDPDRSVREAAIVAMRHLSIYDRKSTGRFAGKVASLLKDESSDVRHSAALALGYMGADGVGEEAGKIATLLAQSLKDSNSGVRSAAAYAIGRMGEEGWPFASDLAAVLKDPDESVRKSALGSLGEIGKSAANFAPDVSALLSDKDPAVREAAARTLERMGEKPVPRKE